MLEGGADADAKKYLFLLYTSAASLLSFKGYTPKTVCDAVNGQSIITSSKFKTTLKKWPRAMPKRRLFWGLFVFFFVAFAAWHFTR